MVLFSQGKSKTDWGHNLTRSTVINSSKKSGSGPFSTDQSEFSAAGATGDSECVGYRRSCSLCIYICSITILPSARLCDQSGWYDCDSEGTASSLISEVGIPVLKKGRLLFFLVLNELTKTACKLSAKKSCCVILY